MLGWIYCIIAWEIATAPKFGLLSANYYGKNISKFQHEKDFRDFDNELATLQFKCLHVFNEEIYKEVGNIREAVWHIAIDSDKKDESSILLAKYSSFVDSFRLFSLENQEAFPI